MNAFQVVTEKVAKAAGFLARAAARLVNEAETLSVNELSGRLGGVLRALRGEEVPTSGAATTSLTTAKTSLQLANEIVESYTFDRKTGVSTLTVPAGVTDVEAMKALNEYFRKNLSYFGLDAVSAGDFDWYENLPEKQAWHCQKRDYSQARQITIRGVVEETELKNRIDQARVLRNKTLVFPDPRDQAIVAAAHACKHKGQDLFKKLWVRGSVPRFALGTFRLLGVCVVEFHDGDRRVVAASGSPSPELKKT